LAYLWAGPTNLQGKISRNLKKWTAGANWRMAGLGCTRYSVAHTLRLQEASLEAGGASGSFVCGLGPSQSCARAPGALQSF